MKKKENVLPVRACLMELKLRIILWPQKQLEPGAQICYLEPLPPTFLFLPHPFPFYPPYSLVFLLFGPWGIALWLPVSNVEMYLLERNSPLLLSFWNSRGKETAGCGWVQSLCVEWTLHSNQVVPELHLSFLGLLAISWNFILKRDTVQLLNRTS